MAALAAGGRLRGRPWSSALLPLVLVAGLAAGSLADHDFAAASSAGRTTSPASRGSLGRRALLVDQCGICPAADAAISTCATVSLADKRQLLRTAIQFCSDLAISPASCCVSMPTSNPQQWGLWSACLWWVLAFWLRSGNAFREGPN